MPTTRRPTQEMFFDDTEEQPPKSSPQAPPMEEVAPDPVVGSGQHNVLELPSNGVHGYPREVKYREILVGDEEVLATATPETYAKTLNSVLKSILNDCSFYEQMTVYDRDFALIWLWAYNYDMIKDVEITCQHCEKKEAKKVDLQKVPVTEAKENLPVPFRMPLKRASVEYVDLRMITVANELEVNEYLIKNPKADYEIASLVSTMDFGVKTTLDNKMKWARENVTSAEMGIIRNFHRYFKYGVDSTIEHVCSECQGVTRGEIPFQTEDVLRPSVRADFEEFLRTVQGAQNTSK